MKIAQVISTPPFAWATGGCARVAYELSRELASAGHEVTLLTTDLYRPNERFSSSENPVYMDGIKIYRFKCISHWLAWKRKIFISLELINHLLRHISDYDIVHLQDLISIHAIFTCCICAVHHKPYVITTHGSVRWLLERKFANMIYFKIFGFNILQKAYRIISVGEDDARLCTEIGISETKIERIPNGIDLQKFENLPLKGSFRRNFGFGFENKLILYLGRIHKRKGIDHLIRAFSLLIKELPNCILVIAGEDDGYRETLENLINSMNIAHCVKFVGYVENVGETYQDVDVVVYPADEYEIFGLVPFEAILCGTPVVVSEKCGCGDLVARSKCGCLAKYGDIYDLRNKIKYLLQNPEKGNKMVERGRSYIKFNLGWNIITKKTEIVYKNSYRHGNL